MLEVLSDPPFRLADAAVLGKVRLGGARTDAADIAQSEDRIRLLESQNQVLELIARGAPVEKSLRRLAVAVADALVADVCAVYLLDANGGGRYVAGSEMPAGFATVLQSVAVDPVADPLGIAALRREPVVLADMVQESRWPGFREGLGSLGLRSCWVQPILSEDGETFGILAVHHSDPRAPSGGDIRFLDGIVPLARIAIEYDRRAQALRQADERLASLASSLPGVVYQRVVTPEGDIFYTYISEGARDLFGVSAEEILADPAALFDCHGPEYRATFRENLLAASRELKMWDVEAPIITRDGEHKWTHAIARPHRRSDGAVVWNGIILDATRIKQANIALGEASRAKSEFLANMSHELRTPLNAIIGFSEIMRDQQFGPLGNARYAEYADDIHHSGSHLLDVINDILDLARIESGKLELDEEVVDPRHAIEASVRLVKERAAAHDISLVLDIACDLPRLRADERQLKQILTNLLSNAVKFTPDGGRVVVSGRIGDTDAVVLSVSDTGIGIDRAFLPRLFEPFAQAESGLDRKFEGTGLGLPLTRAMVELHGASLELESSPGRGTTATIRFPPQRTVA